MKKLALSVLFVVTAACVFGGVTDYIAYQCVTGTVIRLWDGNDESTTVDYVWRGRDDAVTVGDVIYNTTNLVDTYAYGNGFLGVGTNLLNSSVQRHVYDFVTGTNYVIVHKQVYDAYGFDSTTAVKGGAHTKEVTRVDRKAVLAYVIANNLYSLDWSDEKSKPQELIAGRNDFDHDGIPDGWELYVGASPWKYADRKSDWDEDALKLYQEYDKGHYPTSPWMRDTDLDTIYDVYAYHYHLKGDDAGKDNDGDGLSNYAEYLASNVFRIASVNPDNPTSCGVVPDFYLKPYAELYLGETLSGFANLNVDDNPRYTSIHLTTHYYSGDLNGRSAIIVHAWNETSDPDMVGVPQEVFATIPYCVSGDAVVSATNVLDLSSGLSMLGKYKLVVFADENGDGAFTVGEPMGFLRGVELGASNIDAWLSRSSIIIPRYDLTSNVYSAEPGSVSNYTDKIMASTNELTRVRIVRYKVNGLAYLGIDDWDLPVCVGQLLVDKYIDTSIRPYLFEGDCLGDEEYDLDWSTMLTMLNTTSRAVHLDGSTEKVHTYRDPTNIVYAIILGGGAFDVLSTNDLRASLIHATYTRRFDGKSSRLSAYSDPIIRPVIDYDTPKDFVYSATPMFKFDMRNGYGSRFDGYTAFMMKITAGSTTITNGFYMLPTAGLDKWFAYTLNETIGEKLPDHGNYQISVSIGNAKYHSGKVQDYTVAEWSNVRNFVVDMNNQQSMNDHGYSSIASVVKYAGPRAVMGKGQVIVQAFENRTFSGTPSGQTVVGSKSTVIDLNDVNTNATIKGVRQGGTYYLRAFIDNDNDYEKDDTESWGYSANPVIVSAETKVTPTVRLWLSDTDTDGDWIPDAYEMVTKNNLTTLKGEALGSDLILFTTNDYVSAASISTSDNGASLTTFQSSSAIVRGTLLGEKFIYTNSIQAIRDATTNAVLNAATGD